MSARRRFVITELDYDPRFQNPSYQWALMSANNVILMVSARTFESVVLAKQNIKLIRRTIALAGVEVQ